MGSRQAPSIASAAGKPGRGSAPRPRRTATTRSAGCVPGTISTVPAVTLTARTGQAPWKSFPVAQAGEVVSFSASVKNVGSVAANGVWFSYGSADASRRENLGDLAPGAVVTRTWQEAVTPGPCECPDPRQNACCAVWIAACGAAANAGDGCAWLLPWIQGAPPPIGTGPGPGIDLKLLLAGVLAVTAIWFFSQYEVTRE